MRQNIAHPSPGCDGFDEVVRNGHIGGIGWIVEGHILIFQGDDESSPHRQIHHPRQVRWDRLGNVIQTAFVAFPAYLHLSDVGAPEANVVIGRRRKCVSRDRPRINLGQLDHSLLPNREIRPIGGPPTFGVDIIKPAKITLSPVRLAATFDRGSRALNHGVGCAGGDVQHPGPLKGADFAVAVASPSHQLVTAGAGIGTALIRSLHGQDVALPHGEFLHGVEPGGRITLAITGIAPDHHGSVFQNGGGVAAPGGNLGHKTRLGGVTFGGSIVSEIRRPLKRHILGAQRLRDYRQGLTHVGCRRKRGGTSFLAGGDHGGARRQEGHRRSADPRHVGVGTLVIDGQPAAGRGRQCESSAIHHLRGQGSKGNRLGGAHGQGLGLAGGHHIIFVTGFTGLGCRNHRGSRPDEGDGGTLDRRHGGVGRDKAKGRTTGGLGGSQGERRIPHGFDGQRSKDKGVGSPLDGESGRFRNGITRIG